LIPVFPISERLDSYHNKQKAGLYPNSVNHPFSASKTIVCSENIFNKVNVRRELTPRIRKGKFCQKSASFLPILYASFSYSAC